MPPIEVGAPRAIGAVSAEIARRAGEQTTTTAAPAAQTPAKLVATSEALNPGEAPVDTDRVAAIRKAVESGQYPLVPARIADAMIAAGILLRTDKA
jgi:negative regulator of flagellin synthesis FlgM